MNTKFRKTFIIILIILTCTNYSFNFSLRIHDMGFTYPFNPARVSNCKLWLDATDLSTITYDSTYRTVSEWRDKSGNGNDFSQVNTSSQPYLNEKNPYITFIYYVMHLSCCVICWFRKISG